MAEQEACANAVTEALNAALDGEERANGENGADDVRGESLLLPLLQGLVRDGRLAAGLGAAGAGVLLDVRRALARLRAALTPPAAHPHAVHLLALADRLDEALDRADNIDGRRRPRRRNRAARHTVGLTQEELQEARRLVDRDQLALAIEPQKENISFHDPVSSRYKPTPIAHSASYTSKVKRDAHVVTRKPGSAHKSDYHRHSIADSSSEQNAKNSIAYIASKFNGQVQKELVPQSPELRRDTKPATFYRPLPPTYNFAAPPVADDEPFNNLSKKSRMKRANTIDISRSCSKHKCDSDFEEEAPLSRLRMPEFKPQTDNDKKFLAFMQRNDQNNEININGQASWSNRFGNIKHLFEKVDQEEPIRPPSGSSAKRFWRDNDSVSITQQSPKQSPANITCEKKKLPWNGDRKSNGYTPHLPTSHPPRNNVPPLPTAKKTDSIKPFVTKPIPVNQFSHAPLSAFKPLKKIVTPTSTSPVVWSPSSANLFPQITQNKTKPLTNNYPVIAPPWTSENRNSTNQFSNKENYKPNPILNDNAPNGRLTNNFTPLRTPQTNSYPLTSIPAQNGLTSPQLVKQISKMSYNDTNVPKIDAEKLQIEFYEKQILKNRTRERSFNGHERDPSQKPFISSSPSVPTTYTLTDYTPPNVVSTFVPLQQTPDIEKAKAHKVDYLPDVVMTEVADDDAATEHERVETRVMRGPVRGAATVTQGARSRSQRAAAASLRGALDRTQVRPAPPHPPPPRPHAFSPRSPNTSLSSASSSPARLSRASSMHLLAVPKLYEGGIARDKLAEKIKTVEAYFSGRSREARETRGGAPAQGFALGRSRTMPTVAELQLLDESNVDDAFEDLVSALA